MNSLDCEGTAADEAVANKPAVAVHKIKPRMFSQFSDQKIDKEKESEYVQMKYVASECLSIAQGTDKERMRYSERMSIIVIL